jgi:hypothetical protein
MQSDPEYRERHRASSRKTARKHRASQTYRDTFQQMLEARKGDGRGRIYFIQAASGPVKIGYTAKKVNIRLHELRVGNHEELTLLGAVLGTKQEEDAIHLRWEHLLIRGEWFRGTPELLQAIAVLLAAATM